MFDTGVHSTEPSCCEDGVGVGEHSGEFQEIFEIRIGASSPCLIILSQALDDIAEDTHNVRSDWLTICGLDALGWEPGELIRLKAAMVK